MLSATSVAASLLSQHHCCSDTQRNLFWCNKLYNILLYKPTLAFHSCIIITLTETDTYPLTAKPFYPHSHTEESKDAKNDNIYTGELKKIGNVVPNRLITIENRLELGLLLTCINKSRRGVFPFQQERALNVSVGNTRAELQQRITFICLPVKPMSLFW